MPGVEVMEPSEDSQAVERPLLRSHKTLPRRGVIVPSIEIVQPVSPDPNGKLTATPAPPLTPPGAGPEEAVVDERTPQKMEPSLSDLPASEMLTPRRPSKPPTPDVTPPRTDSNKRPTLNQFSYFSSSSRADSFQTALESISSEDMDTPGRMSQIAKPARQRIQPSKPNASNGYHSQFANTKLPPSASQQSDAGYDGFKSFDGDWAASLVDGSPTPLAGKRNTTHNHTQLAHQPEITALDIEQLNSSLMREKALRDRVNGNQVKASPSMEQFRENIGWPSPKGPARSAGSDARPLSVISSTSTVEAMIIDSPRQTRRMLRHTEKRSSLRSVSSPITRSERTSYDSQTQHRLIHKDARISDQDCRGRSSEISFSTQRSNSAMQPKIETINVVVIPERTSSLKSRPNSHAFSKPDSRRSSRSTAPRQTKQSDSMSIRSQNDSKIRPMERPFIPQRSSSLSAPTSRNNSRTTSITSNSLRSRPMEHPVITRRSSSLSAPTSRNNSRATSLTSDSLRSHNLAMDQEMQKGLENQPLSPPRHNILASPNRHDSLEIPSILFCASNSDMVTLRPPSLPFTQGSVPSYSPGPVEIQEATAVSLFSHNNRSLLLVDPRVQAPRRSLQALEIPNGSPRIPVNNLTKVDSPLRNPRPPPKPPVGKPLPPIPLQDAQDENKGLGRRWGSVRRPWSSRPRSDSFNSLARSCSMKSAKNRTAGMEMDSRLHPFWRPRGFWEDIPGSPEKEPSPTRQPSPRHDESWIVNNSLGLPQRRIAFQGPPALAHRGPEMKRLLNGMTSNGSLVDQGMFRSGSPLTPTHFRTLSRWGLHLQSISWRNMRNRLRRARQRRDERKRAMRRETLKQSIGGPVYIASSASPTAGVAMI
ncbi:hypothetical protein N7457_008386 [Penicillium paradoxum]|uniref:uncharacterized protein n=1 Tax=Penicillium paradoxum TaxID=176176 RepID=UPI002549983D|nr:uncharacterized protein N7457_008386 [Penicillium paradoxum]KAJ5773490.1 hypothetical protein N7457_008386 [Penicillium paradoxum]